jgi:hypothetical protein
MAVSQTLSVTEVSGSVNTTANTSKVRILWKSTQTGESWNGYTRTAKYYVSINGGAETEYSVSYTLPQSATKTIVDVTLTINHKSDGSGTVKVRTWMDTSISAGIVEKTQTLTLTTIPRASTITTAYAITLGNSCKIKFTPAAKSFWYKLVFSIGNWSANTEVFNPGVTSAYTYTGLTVPLDVANQFPNDPSATMTATLYTYSSKDAAAQVGSASSKGFTVTLPENASTKPTVEMTLSPVTPHEKFASLYLQGISKVKATFTGEAEYGASVESYSLQAEGGSYSSPYTSDILRKSGTIGITGKVTDSRGFSNTTTANIDVIAYAAPYIAPSNGYTRVICERCTEDGVASDTGTYLHVKGTRNYTKINTNGIVNTCSVRCRYKPQGGSWSHNSGSGIDVLLWTDTSTDEFDVILPNIVSDIKISYTVELNIVDDTYLTSAIIFNVPYANVDFNLRDGGRGAAFGKYSTIEDMLECDWDARFNGKVYLGESEINAVIEQGTKSVNTAEGTAVVWHYRKWLDGSAECWCRRNVDVNVNMAWGSALHYGMATTINYPFAFAERPMCQTTCEYGNDSVSLFIASSGTGTNVYATPVMLCRTDAKTVNCNILYQVHGRWK